MESILKSLQSLFPLVTFYPQWAQLLFLTTFILSLISFASFVILYNDAATRCKNADNKPATELIDVGTSLKLTSSAPSTPGGSIMDPTASLLAYKSEEFANSFPVLDLKFHNAGKTPELITRIRMLSLDVDLDITPAIEYSLEVDSGDLVLAIRNFGWADARSFVGYIDLSPLERALRLTTVKKIEVDALPQAIRQNSGQFTSIMVPLIEKSDIDSASLPNGLRKPPAIVRSRENEAEFWRLQKTIETNGLSTLRLTATYADTAGRSYTDEIDVVRVQRGAYDTRNIYFGEDGFEYVEYDRGFLYSLLSPSASYNFLVDMDAPARADEISVAHEVPPGGFDRISLTIGASKSAILRFRLEFETNAARKISSPELTIPVWNPRNTFASIRGATRVSEFAEVRDSSRKPYDLKAQRDIRSRSWGY
jgi:hypothetical protein